MPSHVVIGAGISGLACAHSWQASDLQIIDRGRRVGGRMATKTLRDTGTQWDGHLVDYGASYFTVTDERFATQVEQWKDKGLVRPWTDTFHVYEPGGIIGTKTGPMRYSAPLGLRSLVQDMADSLNDVAFTFSTEVATLAVNSQKLLIDDQAADAAALCLPAPQASRFANALLPAIEHTWEPVIAVTLVFNDRVWQELDGVFVNNDPVLTWIADDGKRRGDNAAVLVAHVNPVLAAAHLQDPHAVIPHAIAAVCRVLGIPEQPDWADAHRWSLARPLDAEASEYWLHPDLPLGMAGDAWAGGPRVEAAWLSGHALGLALASH